MPKYLAIIRPSMEGPYTDTLINCDEIFARMLANRFRPANQKLVGPASPNLFALRMRANMNSGHLIAFESEHSFTFESFDDFLRSMEKEELDEFFKRHRHRTSSS